MGNGHYRGYHKFGGSGYDMGKVRRKSAVLAGGAGILVMLLFGCGRAKPWIAETQKPEDTTITVLASQNWVKDIDRELFVEFEEESGINVKLLLTPDNRYESFVGKCLSGGSVAVDIFMFSTGAGNMAAGVNQIAVDLSEEEWVDGLEDWALEACSYNGKVIGFNTWGEDYEGILYNKTYFDENNLEVPDTWEEFLSLCDRICELGTVPLYEGINSSWHTRSWVDGLTPVLYEEIPDLPKYLNESPQHKFEDIDTFCEGIRQMQRLFSEKKYYTSDGQDEEFQGSYRYLKERKTVMIYTYSAYAAELEAYGSQDEWGMFPSPLVDNQTGVSNGGGIAKYISKNSRNIEACKELFRFLAREENLERYYKARSDLVTSAFRDIKNVQGTDATREILSRSKEKPPVMLEKDVQYIDPDIYRYIRGFADGTCTAEEFIRNCDAYRMEMFESYE